MATYSSVLAWRIPGMAEPAGLPSMGSQSRTRLKRLGSSSSSSIPYFNLYIAERKKKSIPSPILTLRAFMTQCVVGKYVLRLSLGGLSISFQGHQRFLSVKKKSYKLRLSFLSTSPTSMNGGV